MSDSQTVTIPAADHAATAETRPARLLRALAQNPEPLSAPALAGLLAEPGRRWRLLSAYDHTLRRHEHAGHVERAGRERNGHGRPAIIWRITTAGRRWLDDHDNAPARAAAAAAQARRAAAQRDRALDEARASFDLQTPRISRKRAAHQLRDLGCTLDQIGAVFHVSKERSARTSSGTRWQADPRESPSRARASAPGKRNSSWVCQHRPSPRSPACSARPGAATEPGRTTLRPAVAVGVPGPERRNNLAAARQQPQ